MEQPVSQNQKGFTLIEIAIVMVIIGLLLGGVLKGQEIIENGKLKSAMTQVNGITAAYYSYINRYRAMPGDDSGALARFDAPAVNGNGNNAVTGRFDSTTDAHETRQFFQHLRLSGLLSGSGSNQPVHPWGGIMGVQNNVYGMRGLSVCFDDLEGETAAILDSQNDDGNPSTGSVRGATTARGIAPTATAYTNNAVYDLCFQI